MTTSTDWARTPGGVLFPGAAIGHTDPIPSSAGGDRVEAFFARHIRQSKGRWRSRPVNFYPEQRAAIHETFRTELGRRIHNEVLLGEPRKNGKSTLVAGLGLYLLVADGEPAPEVYGAAGSREQARVVFQEAARMVAQSPTLSEWCDVRRNEIIVPSIDGVYRAVSAEGGLQMGTNPSGVVGDELHVWKGDAGRELYYALTTGMDARENPLALLITTAGYELDSIAYEVYQRGVDVDDDDLFMYWVGAPEGAPVDDPATWMAANPAPWITERRLARAFKRLPPAVFARLHLNQWTQTEALWLPQGAWDRCAGDQRILEGERVWVGVDIGFKRDASAVVELARRDGQGPGGKPLYVARAYIFEPAVGPDGALDLAPVENKIRWLGEHRQVVEVRYDRTLFQRSAEDLSETLVMVEVPWASNQRVVEMSQALYELIVEQAIRHDGDRTFKQHVEAAVVRETESGWRVSKQKSKRRIDALAALLMAVGGAAGPAAPIPGVRFL